MRCQIKTEMIDQTQHDCVHNNFKIVYPLIHKINPFSTGTVFICQNLTYKDGPHTERITNISNSRRPIT